MSLELRLLILHLCHLQDFLYLTQFDPKQNSAEHNGSGRADLAYNSYA
jgi:hypothetical protein